MLYSLNAVNEYMQNNNAEVIEVITGSLLDDMLFAIDDDVYAALEVAVTHSSSAYKLISGDDVLNEWQKRYDQYIEYLKEIGDYETLALEI